VAALYGVGRSGMAFVCAFQGWLLLNGWSRMVEAPALFYQWHDEDETMAIRRAIENKKLVDGERKNGLDILAPMSDNPKQTKRWSDVYEAATKLDSEVDDKKRHCTNTSQCSVLGTYVDDGLLSAAARYRKTIWKVVRIMFESDEPEEVKRFLGMHVTLIADALQYIVGLGMQEYNENVVRTHEEVTGKAARVCTTTGQSTEGPDPKDLPLVACGRRPRGELEKWGIPAGPEEWTSASVSQRLRASWNDGACGPALS
jgi:hypothetical protein